MGYNPILSLIILIVLDWAIESALKMAPVSFRMHFCLFVCLF